MPVAIQQFLRSDRYGAGYDLPNSDCQDMTVYLDD
jgi:hypothetical protein